MVRTAVTAALCCVLFSVNAEARSRKPSVMHPQCNTWFPCIAPDQSSPDQVRITRGEYVARQMGGFGGPNRKRKAARHHARHHHDAHNRHSHKRTLTYRGTEPSDAFGKPMRFISGRLVCALNVNAALAERGIRGTGSALALSFMRWGHSAGGPVPGAVIVSRRRGGGHVAIVSRVVDGKVFAWNATGGRRDWREIPYRHRVLDYRMPG